MTKATFHIMKPYQLLCVTLGNHGCEMHMNISLMRLLFVLFVLNSSIVEAEELLLTSGQEQTVLIELFTSEGCSSCPPAEEYINGLTRHPELWKTYVPVAFHVNYWDYIGWRDPYAHATHGKRQYWYARHQNLPTVYTPAFVVNGKAWRRGWDKHEPARNTHKTGELKVKVKDSRVVADFNAINLKPGNLTLNIALLGMDLISHIEAGENEGRTARHEFVVLGFRSVNSQSSHWEASLPELHYSGARRYALAAWVSLQNDPTPLQAVGGELPITLIKSK